MKSNDVKVLIGVATILVAIVAYERHPSGRRYWEIWLAALGLIS